MYRKRLSQHVNTESRACESNWVMIRVSNRLMSEEQSPWEIPAANQRRASVCGDPHSLSLSLCCISQSLSQYFESLDSLSLISSSSLLYSYYNTDMFLHDEPGVVLTRAGNPAGERDVCLRKPRQTGSPSAPVFWKCDSERSDSRASENALTDVCRRFASVCWCTAALQDFPLYLHMNND